MKESIRTEVLNEIKKEQEAIKIKKDEADNEIFNSIKEIKDIVINTKKDPEPEPEPVVWEPDKR